MFSNSLPPRVKYGSVEEERKMTKRREAFQFTIRLHLIVKKIEGKYEEKKIEIKSRREKKVEKKMNSRFKVRQIIFIIFFKSISLIFLYYIKIKQFKIPYISN